MIRIPLACFSLSLFKMLMESNPALSHSCLGMTSSALATALMISCSLPAMVRAYSRRYLLSSISIAPPPAPPERKQLSNPIGPLQTRLPHPPFFLIIRPHSFIIRSFQHPPPQSSISSPVYTAFNHYSRFFPKPFHLVLPIPSPFIQSFPSPVLSSSRSHPQSFHPVVPIPSPFI